MGYAQYMSRVFRAETKLSGKITLKKLKKAANQKGFIVRNYSNSYEHFLTYGLLEKSKKCSSFLQIDSDGNVLIFLDEQMSISKQVYALAHEIGHYFLGHYARNITNPEEEADLFAQCLLINDKPHPWLSILILAALFATLEIGVLAFLRFAFTQIPDSTLASTDSPGANIIHESDLPDNIGNLEEELSEFEIYFWTDSGTVYHSDRSCYHIKNSTNVHSGTLSEAQEEKERLCKTCEKSDN